jgi:hypothetical protein
VTNHAELGGVANTHEATYGPHFVVPDGTWSGLGERHSANRGSSHGVAPEAGLDLPESEGRTPGTRNGPPDRGRGGVGGML